MKRNIRPFLAAALAAVMLSALAGCAENDTPESSLSSKPSGSKSSSSIISSSKDDNPNSAPESPMPEKITYAPTNEIKNADFGSGLIQMNNEVFRQGGYITVAELAEKCKDTYDIRYFAPQNGAVTTNGLGSYDECKEYVLSYKKPAILPDSESVNTFYYLNLIPKLGEDPSAHAITVKIGNATSPDEKITLDKAVVLSFEVCPINDRYKKSHLPIWAAHGIYLSGNNFNNDYTHRWEKPDGIKSELDGYTPKKISEFLDGLGVKSIASVKELDNALNENGTVYVSGGRITVYAMGEANLFGARPVYEYTFNFDSNTDKLSEVYCKIREFK